MTSVGSFRARGAPSTALGVVEGRQSRLGGHAAVVAGGCNRSVEPLSRLRRRPAAAEIVPSKAAT